MKRCANLRTRGSQGRESLLKNTGGHLAVDEQHTARLGGRPRQELAAGSHGIGDAQRKMRFPRPTSRMHHDEPLGWQPGGKKVLADRQFHLKKIADPDRVEGTVKNSGRRAHSGHRSRRRTYWSSANPRRAVSSFNLMRSAQVELYQVCDRGEKATVANFRHDERLQEQARLFIIGTPGTDRVQRAVMAGAAINLLDPAASPCARVENAGLAHPVDGTAQGGPRRGFLTDRNHAGGPGAIHARPPAGATSASQKTDLRR